MTIEPLVTIYETIPSEGLPSFTKPSRPARRKRVDESGQTEATGETLHTIINNLKEEVTELEVENERLLNESMKLKKDATWQDAHISDLEERLDAMMKENNDVVSRQANLRRQNDCLARSFAILEEENKRLVNEINVRNFPRYLI
jgi:chromosome segregation ATPase